MWVLRLTVKDVKTSQHITMPIGHILLASPSGKSMPLSMWAPNHSECAFPIAEIDLVTGGDIKELHFLKNFLFFPSVTLLIQLGSAEERNLQQHVASLSFLCKVCLSSAASGSLFDP